MKTYYEMVDPPRIRKTYKNLNKEWLIAVITRRRNKAVNEKLIMTESQNIDFWQGKISGFDEILKILLNGDTH